MNKIDDQGYKDGGAAFAKGKTLRQIVEMKFANTKKADDDKDHDWQKAEQYQESYELGFADGLLAKLRAR